MFEDYLMLRETLTLYCHPWPCVLDENHNKLTCFMHFSDNIHYLGPLSFGPQALAVLCLKQIVFHDRQYIFMNKTLKTLHYK